jgi:outer membrane protein OmpA-like peptidoglycan-associated protein
MSFKRTSCTVAFPLIALLASLGACGSSAPSQELVDARKLYDQARQSPAAQLAPADLLTAQQALQGAEAAHEDDPASERERALAYIAQRKAAQAIALGGVQEAKREQDALNEKYKGLQDQLRKKAEQDAAKNAAALKENQSALNRVRDQLSEQGNKLSAAAEALKKQEAELAARQKALEEQNKALAVTQSALEAERKAREEAEKRAAAALASLAEVAKVKEEQRGLVITLDGSVLFASGKTALLPIAKNKLDSVARALKEQDPNKKSVVEGHTDSVGSDDANLRLSQARADSVREYLVSQGVPGDKISAVGKGETQPIADNKTPEGRANNRRVEIIIK